MKNVNNSSEGTEVWFKETLVSTDNRVQNILEELKNQAKLEKTIKLISALA